MWREWTRPVVDVAVWYHPYNEPSGPIQALRELLREG